MAQQQQQQQKLHKLQGNIVMVLESSGAMGIGQAHIPDQRELF